MPNGNHFIACTGLKHDLDGDRVEVVPQDVGKIEPPFLLLFFLLSLRFLYFYTTSVTVYLSRKKLIKVWSEHAHVRLGYCYQRPFFVTSNCFLVSFYRKLK